MLLWPFELEKIQLKKGMIFGKLLQIHRIYLVNTSKTQVLFGESEVLIT